MGVIHHSHYPVYFEAGRTDFFNQHLSSYHEMEEQGLFAPVLELNLKIEGRASYGDVLHLTTKPDWLKGVRLAMSYDVTLADGRKVASGQTVHALVGRDLKAMHPRKFHDLYQKISRAFQPHAER